MMFTFGQRPDRARLFIFISFGARCHLLKFIFILSLRSCFHHHIRSFTAGPHTNRRVAQVRNNMVQELQKEEFFNLSTLAEVTLIAGKLSTTDINEIKNYISNKSDDMSQANKQQQQHQQLNYESTKKKWKANWESSTTARLSCSSSISSDDDSTKSLLSYSHKVFDRKKQRSFKQSSTESEYDFHQFDHRHHFESMKSLSCDSSSCSNSDESCSLLHDKLQSSNEVGSSEHAAASSTSGEEGSMNDHICPECGKKYSTSESLFIRESRVRKFRALSSDADELQ